MRARFLLTIGGSFLSGLCVVALCLSAEEPGVLPARLAGWERTDFRQVDARRLESVAADDAAVLREYGCTGAENAAYSKGSSRWQVTLFRMQDRTGASGALTLLGGVGPPMAVGESGTRTPRRIAFYQGNNFLWAEPLADEAALRALAQALRALPEYVASLPALSSFLPVDGLVRGSEQYFLGPTALARVFSPAPGDWVGFAYGAEVQLARYRQAGAEVTLLLISYPTPQIAAERMRSFEALFSMSGTVQPSRQAVLARRKGTLVALVSGHQSTEAADRLIEGVNYTTQVSWSDPSDPRAQINWPHTVLNIFLGTGLILLFTLASGIGYGLLRLALTRFFPGVIFDRPSEGDVIIFKLEAPPPK